MICLDENLSSNMFKNQITTLIIAINPNRSDLFTKANICKHIFTAFMKLTHLVFHELSYEKTVRLLFDTPPHRFSSSTLLVLNIQVQCFYPCLCILDGRFNQLHTLVIELANIFRPNKNIQNKVKIPNLKRFCLSCVLPTSHYNDLILPLICRMSNLEQLGLYLMVNVSSTFIDGETLKKDILNRMPQLKQFAFDIYSYMIINNLMNLPSRADIQQTFKDFQNITVISCVDYFLERSQGQCHVYSYPSLMKYYENATNNFPGGLYPYVRVVSLYDKYPFEHAFFIRIQKSFPFMRTLSVNNFQPQNHKESCKSMNGCQNLSIAQYNYLNKLNIQHVHDDYIEEFLLNTKTYFQNDLSLNIDYESLERVTRNFTRDDTRINCTKINKLHFFGKTTDFHPDRVQDYFSGAKIR
ncbi:unnamed protein product [Rotaria magnacalcarata]|uniref:Uncharacterized protein n=1 Tax=Rotaria magnacalcarata TaxID=392030 RepID=A0A816PVP2_9BILA|nr:unnamed protein product [Rotaria magnacalcarata]CAF2053528.1 unnamed protein product [Rotaria magnacalcarata]